MNEVDAAFELALKFSGKDDADTNEQQFAAVEDARSKFATFQKRVLATFPALFDKEGNPVMQQVYKEEYAKLEKETYEGKEQEMANVLIKYVSLAHESRDLPKDVDAISAQKQANADKRERRRQLMIGAVDLVERLQAEGALVKDKTLEQDVIGFNQAILAEYPKGLRKDSAINKEYQTVLALFDQLKKGQSSTGQTGGQTTTGTGGTTTTTVTNPGKDKLTKPITATPPKKKTDDKKGMAWHWWLVIIVGILSVLGAVAYLFLGTDPANDEEYSPEQEA